MATQYDVWLDTLGTLRADMPMTTRGLAVLHEVTYPGNVTTATLEGAIKAAPDSATELATFTIGTPAFADGLTVWEISLTGTQTGNLPADTDGDGREDFIFDLVLTISGGDPQRIVAGLFPVSGFVTEPA